MPRTTPVIGLPFSVAIGISIRIVPGRTRHVPLPSHPEQRESLAHERAVAELAPRSSDRASRPLSERSTASPCRRGCRLRRTGGRCRAADRPASACRSRRSPRPRRARCAAPASDRRCRRCAAASGSRPKSTLPTSFSYGPAAPNARPFSTTSRRSMRSRTTRASASERQRKHRAATRTLASAPQLSRCDRTTFNAEPQSRREKALTDTRYDAEYQPQRRSEPSETAVALRQPSTRRVSHGSACSAGSAFNVVVRLFFVRLRVFVSSWFDCWSCLLRDRSARRRPWAARRRWRCPSSPGAPAARSFPSSRS